MLVPRASRTHRWLPVSTWAPSTAHPAPRAAARAPAQAGAPASSCPNQSCRPQQYAGSVQPNFGSWRPAQAPCPLHVVSLLLCTRSILRRMHADAHPEPPRPYHKRAVELESGDCGPADRCLADDVVPCCCPCEVLSPALLSGIEQRYGLSG